MVVVVVANKPAHLGYQMQSYDRPNQSEESIRNLHGKFNVSKLKVIGEVELMKKKSIAGTTPTNWEITVYYC